jgi:hypothetical protein
MYLGDQEMQTSATRRRSRIARPLSWLVVAGLAGAALIGPGAGAVSADGGPGSPDFVPNSGHTSSSGLTLVMGTGVMSCDGASVTSLSGSFTFSGADAGDHVVIYLTPNNGSDASPVGNVENNEITIELDGKTSPVDFTLPITSPFTTTKGGVLLVFASSVEWQQVYTSKSNTLNSTETTTTTSSSTTTSTTDTSTTDTSTTDTSTTDTTTTDTSTTETTSTGTESSVTTTNSTTETSSTGTESGITTTNSTSSSSSGGELPIVGTPKLTPPTTDTVGAVTPAGSADGYRFILLGIAFILAMILLLQPKEVASRK